MIHARLARQIARKIVVDGLAADLATDLAGRTRPADRPENRSFVTVCQKPLRIARRFGRILPSRVYAHSATAHGDATIIGPDGTSHYGSLP
jgi:hypothetical protein